MKTFFAATAAVALVGSLAVAACTSDDSEPAAATVLANVGDGGACNATSQCAEGLQCGFPVNACAAQDAGTCRPIGNCNAATWCPCNGDPAFTECNDGKYASEPVSTCSSSDGGSSPDASDASAQVGDSAIDAADAHAETDSGSDGGHASDAAIDAPSDAGTEDASDAAHD